MCCPLGQKYDSGTTSCIDNTDDYCLKVTDGGDNCN